MELRRNTHHVFRIMYDFVWIPKYHHKVFEELYRSTIIILKLWRWKFLLTIFIWLYVLNPKFLPQTSANNKKSFI